MAAAVSSSSRAVAGGRAPRGLFLIFTLLCLVCFASSLMHQDQMETMKEQYKKLRKETDKLKSDMADRLEFIGETLSLLDRFRALMRKTNVPSDDDFFPVDAYLENVKDYVEKIKDRFDHENQKLNAIDDRPEKMNKFIKFFEENEAEL